MVLKYNYFFYPNACHVCKKFGNGISLKRCGKCTMIAYCSKKHQRMHWLQHKDICNAICSVLKDKVSNIFNNKEIEDWTQMKMNFMLLVALKVGRKLQHYEEQMFKFLRSCAVCHDQNVDILEDCPDCPNISFCTKHKDNVTHNSFCSLIKLSFNLDVISMTHKRRIPKINVPCTEHTNLPENIKDFIDLYIEPQKDSEISKWEETVINAEYLTRPLTFLYAVQKLRYPLKDNNITIHVVAANIMDVNGIELWEILLHWLPNVAKLNICLVGPELSSGFLLINLCKNCEHSKKQLSVQMYGMLYETYINTNSSGKPNFIIGYNAGIHECNDFISENDTWKQSLQMIAEQNCPLVLTSYTLAEAEKDQIRLNEVFNSRINCMCSEQNPFSSLRPHRDFETEDVYYQNQCIVIYENLKSN